MIKTPQAFIEDFSETSGDLNDISIDLEDTSTYEVLRRRGNYHEGRRHVLEELKINIQRLSDLHAQLQFILRELDVIIK